MNIIRWLLLMQNKTNFSRNFFWLNSIYVEYIHKYIQYICNYHVTTPLLLYKYIVIDIVHITYIWTSPSKNWTAEKTGKRSVILLKFLFDIEFINKTKKRYLIKYCTDSAIMHGVNKLNFRNYLVLFVELLLVGLHI